METLIGTTLGGYTLTRLIGSGGMGAVYLAEDAAIGQQVAIKVVRADEENYFDFSAAQSNPQHAVDRFKQEARAIASLDHLYILPFYRYGEEHLADGRRAYMVMQYRPEGSLWDWLRLRMGVPLPDAPAGTRAMPAELNQSWPLSVEEAGEYVHQAGSALQYAHDRGIIHRDVKPANFLLRFDSDRARPSGKTVSLLLSDFGLAKLFSSTSATSHVFGTPLYMAPEQFEGAAVPESDQYALAVMAYLMLAGRPPFDGDPAQLMHKHLNMSPPPIRTYTPALSAGVENVLTRALAKRPGERYPSVAEFAQAFTQRMYEAGSRRTAAPAFNLPMTLRVPPTEQPLPLTALPSMPASPHMPLAHNTPQLTLPATQAVPGQAYFPGDAGGQQTLSSNESSPWAPTQVWMPGELQMPGSQPVREPMTPAAPPKKRVSRRAVIAGIVCGVAVLGVAGTGIYLYTNSGAAQPAVTTPTPVPPTQPPAAPSQVRYMFMGHTSSVTDVAWSPDATQLVSSSEDTTVRLWSTASRIQTQIYQGHHLAVLAAAWSPSGVLLASGGRDKTAQVWDAAGTLQRRLTVQQAVTALAWISEKQLFVATIGDGLYELTLATGKAIHRLPKTFIRSMALSPDKQYLAIGTEKGAVTILNLLKGQISLLHFNHLQPVLALAWSPNGLLLASGSSDNTAKVMDVKTDRIMHTLTHPAAVNGLAWHPDVTGSLATACADNIVRVWPAGNGAPTLYQGHTASVNALTWSNGGLASGSQDKTIIVWNLA